MCNLVLILISCRKCLHPVTCSSTPPPPPPWTQALTALLSDDSKFGFIVIDGSGALFGTLQGNAREVLHKFTVDLPKKHGITPHCLLKAAFYSFTTGSGRDFINTSGF